MAAEHPILGEELVRAVELLADTLANHSIRYALIGGLASALRGRPRFTQDVDVLLDVPQVALAGLLDDLARRDGHDKLRSHITIDNACHPNGVAGAAQVLATVYLVRPRPGGLLAT